MQLVLQVVLVEVEKRLVEAVEVVLVVQVALVVRVVRVVQVVEVGKIEIVVRVLELKKKEGIRVSCYIIIRK